MNRMYVADENRYETMKYHRCGNSGLMLPAVSLGLWHNFGSNGNYDNMLDMCFTAFDQGITILTLLIIMDRSPVLPRRTLAAS